LRNRVKPGAGATSEDDTFAFLRHVICS
jgi:hypothetical protein